ncbi:MAG: hypothetical protein GF346_13740, partial [Candidatus Eisenbacteria bacterium]|nr:hypothetical protein [Candidatus Latescibacterota bacterium]MBD3303503.1 hypothetical protein [Candidatus Eisenbacteria bacterium]
MTKKRLLFAIILLATVGAYGCSESENPVATTPPAEVGTVSLGDGIPCGDSLVTILYAGQFIDVGTVTVYNDQDDLFIRIETTGGWWMTESHVAVATTLEDIPQTGKGNPKVGHFGLWAEHDPPVTTYTYSIGYEYEPGVELFLAAHAVVELHDENGQRIQEETAWADGFEFPGNNWATYFTYLIQDCGGEANEICDGDLKVITWDPLEGVGLVRVELYYEYEGTAYLVDSVTGVDNFEGYYEWIVEGVYGEGTYWFQIVG